MENLDIDISILSYDTRLLFSELDCGLIVQRSLDCLADLTRSPQIALMLLDPLDWQLKLVGRLGNSGFEPADQPIPALGEAIESVINSKMPHSFPLGDYYGIPWPVASSEVKDAVCLCAPLVAANNKVTGLVTMALAPGETFHQVISMPLRILLTVVAVALETARLFKLAVYDGLTGLHVRRYFQFRLAEETSRIKRYGGSVSLLFIDIDFFKSINDTYGHLQGDQILVDIARILKETCRLGVDVICRYGGEEFVAILPETDEVGALLVAERIRRNVAGHTFPGPDGPIRVTLSVGVAAMDQDTLLEALELLRRADMALFQAKNQGRNRVEAYSRVS